MPVSRPARVARALLSFLWPAVVEGDLVQAARERLLILFAMITGVAATINLAVAHATGLPITVQIASALLALILLLLVPLHFRRSRKVERSAWLLLLLYTAAIGISVGLTGGLLAGGAVFLLIPPILGGLLLGLRAALAFCVAALALFLAYYLAQDAVGMPVHGMQKALMADDMAVVLGLTAIGLALVAGSFHRVMVRTSLNLKQARDRAEAANAALHRELAARRLLEAELQAHAYTDQLTGLPNRRQFFEQAADMLAATRQAGEGFAVVAMDIDRFKAINDRFGHGAGDRVLRAVADCAGREVPAGGLLARIGGEEFAMALPTGGALSAALPAARMRAAIAGLQLAMAQGENLRLSASFGIATMAGDDTLDRLLARADAAMYVAKRAGGDRVADSDDTDGSA